MFAFAEIMWIVASRLEVVQRLGGISASQSLHTQQKMRSHELAGNETFAALPRVEAPRKQDRQGFAASACKVEERDQLDGEIVARRNQIAICLQSGQAIRGPGAVPLV